MTIKKADKQKLIDNAGELFSVQGYHYTSIADIAGTCGLSKGSLYHYIDSKIDLGKSVIQAMHDIFNSTYHAIAFDQTKPEEVRWEQLINAIYEHFIESPSSALLLTMTAEVVNSVPDFVTALRDFFSAWINTFKHLLVKFLSEAQAQEKAKRVLCELQGAVLFNRLFEDASALTLWKTESLQILQEQETIA